MAIIERENIGLLNDKLIVKIKKEDYLPSFEKKLKEYSKTANIPGFRKGMVPAGMIKKMYGAGIFNDEILKTVEKQLYTYLNDEKPDIFAQPLPLETDMSKMDLNNPSDYDFGFEIGLKPVFEIPNLANAKLTLNKVEVTDDMVEEEVKRMLVKAGKMTEPEEITNEENVLNILFTECDAEGNILEGGISKENSVLLKYFISDAQQQLLGKRIDDQFIFSLNKAFEGEKLEMILHDLGLDKNDKDAASKYFKLQIVKIGLIEKREIDIDFFNEVYPGKNITTEEELRSRLKTEIMQYWESQSRNQLHDQLYHLLIDQTKMEFPESFLKRWLQKGGEKPKTAEEAEHEFPTFSNQLKWTLISDRLIKENKLDVSNDELREHIKSDVSRYFEQMNMGGDVEWLDSYIDRLMKDDKQTDEAYRKLITEKLFTWLESQAQPEEKVVSVEQLAGMQHNHAH